MDEKHQDEKFFRERRWGRYFLYFELIYVLILFWAVQFKFALFAHLLVGQFFIIIAYYVSGWLYGIYLKKTEKAPIDEREKESLHDKLAYRFNTLFWYHFLEVFDICALIIVAARIFSEGYVDILMNPFAVDVFHSLTAYLAFAYFLLLIFTAAGLLMSWRRLVRNFGIAEVILAVVLLLVWPAHWLSFACGAFATLISIFLYYKNKI